MIEADFVRLHAFVEEIAESGSERLPSEPKLSEILGISRGRLRTLLKRLEDKGQIWRHVGKGTFVGQRHLHPDELDYKTVSIDDIINARLAVEPQVAAQAAIHATAADIAAMEQCLEELRSAQNFSQWKRLDERLHRTLAFSTHNVLLLMLYDTLRHTKISLDRRLEEVFGLKGPKIKTDDEHTEVVAAIRAHDPSRAKASMREHLISVRRHLFGLR